MSDNTKDQNGTFGEKPNAGDPDKTFISPVQPEQPGETLQEMSDDTIIAPVKPIAPGETLRTDPEGTIIEPAAIQMTDQQMNDIWGATLQGDVSPGATLKIEVNDEKTLPTRQEESGGTKTTFVKSEVDYPSDLSVRPPGAGSASGGSNYEVIRLLGKGGMGMVYEARQSSLDRNVVLKMVLPKYAANKAAEENFVREALVTGDLDHPNIVPVHELGKDHSGNTFMAMKYVKGESWKDILHPPSGENSELNTREQLEILLKVCDAMAFAHDQGIVHRDLKPENIMVGSYGEVLVMDWGVAVSIETESSSGPRTVPAASVSTPAGTPCYMAPEMARGEGNKIGVCSDVYLLGAILYEILTDTPPHTGSSVTDVLKNASAGNIESPESRIPGSKLPRDLSRIAMKALSPDPADRYSSVQSFAEAIKSYLEHEESLRISEQGLEHLDSLKTEKKIPREERYAVFQETLNLFSQALNMYPENEDAIQGQAEAAVLYSDEAVTRGDIGLASAQIPVLENNPKVKSDKLETLKATVKAKERSRILTFMIAGAVIVGLFLAYKAFSFAVNKYEDPFAVDTQIRESDEQIAKEWGKIREREFEKVKWAANKIWEHTAKPLNGAEFMEHLFIARAVTLWRENDFDQLITHLISDGDFQVSQPGLLDELSNDPELQKIGFSRHLPKNLTVGRRRGIQGIAVWNAISDIARFGVEPGILDKAITIASQHLPSDSTRRMFRNSLLKNAVRHLWLKSAEFRGDNRTLEYYRTKIIPFEFTSPPMGDPIQVSEAESVPLIIKRSKIPPKKKGSKKTGRELGRKKGDPITSFVTKSGYKWTAYNRFSGDKIWELHPSLIHTYYEKECMDPIPVEDGSVVIVTPGLIVRANPITGEILGILYLDGYPVAAWPDPINRNTLVILSQVSNRSGYTHIHRIRAGVFETPCFSSDDFMVNNSVFRFGERRLDFLYEQTVTHLKRGTHRKIIKDNDALKHLVSLIPKSDLVTPFLVLALLENCREYEFTDLSENKHINRAASLVTVHPSLNLPPHTIARIGANLDLSGFPDTADKVYHSGVKRFHELQGNPDLNPILITSPSWFIRASGRKIYEAGNIERALSLVEKGRQFTSYMEGDHRFYRKYAQWLKIPGNKGPVPLSDIERRIPASVEAGGVFLSPARFVVLVDIIIIALMLNPFLIIITVIRSWRESRSTRISDLYSRGIRTFPDRIAAFLTRPFVRMKYTFFAYMPRLNRGFLAFLCLFQILGMAYIAGSIIMISKAAGTKLYFGNGLPGTYAAVSHLEDLIDGGKVSSEAAALLAEGYQHQYRAEDTKRVLENMPLENTNPELHAFRLNNLGVISEENGDKEKARQFYSEAASYNAEASHVAQANLLRLDKKSTEPAVKMMAYRDRLNAVHSEKTTPQWALCSFNNLAKTLDTTGTSMDRLKMGLRKAFVEGQVNYIGAIWGNRAPADDLLTLLWLVVIPLTIFSCIWIPLPVLDRVVLEKSETTRFPRLRKYAVQIAKLPGLFIPGYRQVFWGRLANGLILALCFLLCFGIAKTIYDGGILGSIAEIGQGAYFEGVESPYRYPELGWFGAAGRISFWIMITSTFIYSGAVIIRNTIRKAEKQKNTAG